MKVTSVDVQNGREALPMEIKDEISLTVSNKNAFARSVAKKTSLPRAWPEKNSDAFILDVSKYSTNISTTTFLDQLMCFHAILGKTVATISK